MKETKILKVDPQPNCACIWAYGYEGDEPGCWEGEPKSDDYFGIVYAQGDFIKFPLEIDFVTFHSTIRCKLIDSEWWWVRSEDE